MLKKEQIKLKNYNHLYLDKILEIFVISVKQTCTKDYSYDQIQAWLSSANNKTKYHDTFSKNKTILAFVDDTLIGFGDISKENYLNMLYVHPNYQHNHVASIICDELEKDIIISPIYVDASITAKPFLKKEDTK